MPRIGVIAKLTAAEGRRDDLVEAFGAMFPAVEKEEGTELYILHKSMDDDDVVYFYEMYTGEAALGAHSTSDTMKEVGGSLRGLLAGRPEIIRLEPVRAKGATL
jgi:quinol monooxygenase YgiN